MILTFYLEKPRLSETPFFKFSLLPASLKLPGQFILSRPCRLAATDSLFLFIPAWGANLLLDDAFGIGAGSAKRSIYRIAIDQDTRKPCAERISVESPVRQSACDSALNPHAQDSAAI